MKKAVKKEVKHGHHYICVSLSEYGAGVCGVGATLDEAFEKCNESLDSASEDQVRPEKCTFYSANLVRVDAEVVVKLTLEN